MLPSKYTHFLTPETSEYYLIWQRVSDTFCGAHGGKLKILREAYLGICRWALRAITGIFLRDGQRELWERHLQEETYSNGGRDWVSNQRVSAPEPGRGMGQNLPSTLRTQCTCAGTLASDLRSPSRDTIRLVAVSHQVGYGGLKTLMRLLHFPAALLLL